MFYLIENDIFTVPEYCNALFKFASPTVIFSPFCILNDIFLYGKVSGFGIPPLNDIYYFYLLFYMYIYININLTN